MKTVKSVKELRSLIKAQKSMGHQIGFVPTMGYLHEGHYSLMRAAKAQTHFVVVSIFVNPTQFGPNEDLSAYPRDLERDLLGCEAEGVDLVFAPEVHEMYPEGYSTTVECEGNITKVLCGASRPSHFKGVTSVVAKLFNMVAPDKAFFGQKDAQQVAVIEKMVRELNFDVEIIACPIIRESDGLAMSSRNVYLNTEQRQDALVLSKALKEVELLINQGELRSMVLLNKMRERIESVSSAEIDYIKIVSGETLEDIEQISDDVLIALAVRFGKTRLIDNVRLRLGGN